MTYEELSRLLGGWEGYTLVGLVRKAPDPAEDWHRPEIWLELQPDPDRPKRCSGCGQLVVAVHDAEERTVRDLPLLDADTWLRFRRCRLACPRCGPKLEQLSWLDRYLRVTRRLAASVAMLCRELPIKHVAAYFRLHWDEFAIQKGHRYATVIVEPQTKRVLWVGRGRKREDVRPFFELLGAAGRQRLRAVVMDMNGAYEEEVRQQCPQAAIVFDLFHVVAKYGREVIDRVRVDAANRVRHDKPARKVIKGARWLLLRNRGNIPKQADRVKLRELLAVNRRLCTVYVLKDDLKHLWCYQYEGAARRFWESWYQRAIRSRIAPLKKFARNLQGYLAGILAHCRWPLHTSLLEGINNKIKVIKRMAYGFRDDAYFFLRIRAAFPGSP